MAPDAYAAAIRAKCLDCCCGSRKAVTECGIASCSLWPYRQGGQEKRPQNIEGQVTVFELITEDDERRAARVRAERTTA